MSNIFGVFISYLIGFMALISFLVKRSPNAQQIIDKVRPYYGGVSIFLFLMHVLYLYEIVLRFDLMMSRLVDNPWIMLPILQLILFSTVITAILANDFLSVYVLNRTYAGKEQAKIKWKSTRPYLTLLGVLNLAFATFLLVASFVR